jgi:putative oxidoreductase
MQRALENFSWLTDLLLRKQQIAARGAATVMESRNQTIFTTVLRWWELLTGLLDRLAWMPPLLVRLFVGYFFFETGWAKLHNLPAFVERFRQWGIPYPAFNAALSAWTECLGGALTIAGLATRFVSVAMVINMAVAILTVKLKNVAGLDDFVELDEPLYALFYIWLGFTGAGAVSLDRLIVLALGLRTGTSPAAARGGLSPMDSAR